MPNAFNPERADVYYRLAKKEGYRSRAAYKLMQLNGEYHFLENARVVLDLCSAPGGWAQVCKKTMKNPILILGVDLLKIGPVPGVKFLQGDITSKQVQDVIKLEVSDWKVDVVLNDGAPNVGGGAYSKDFYAQCDLALAALKICSRHLKRGGTFVTKIFRSRDYFKYLYVVNKLFKKVRPFKPDSSRSVSAETFLVCQDYLAPTELDPKIFDPEYVFQDIGDNKQLKGWKAVRRNARRGRAEGYEDGVLVLFKKCPVHKFLEAEYPRPLMMLNDTFTFEDEISKQYLKSETTTKDVLEMCEDLRILGRTRMNQLLRWRHKLLKEIEENEMFKTERARILETEKAREKKKPVEKQEEQEERVLTHLEELLDRIRKRKRNAMKRMRAKRIKFKKQLALSEFSNSTADVRDAEFFTMYDLSPEEKQYLLDENPYDKPAEPSKDEIEKAEYEKSLEKKYRYLSEKEFEDRNDELIDRLYQQKVLRKKEFSRKKHALGMADEDVDPKKLQKEIADMEKKHGDIRKMHVFSNQDLLGNIGKQSGTKMWFQHDIFQGLEDALLEGEEDGQDKGPLPEDKEEEEETDFDVVEEEDIPEEKGKRANSKNGKEEEEKFVRYRDRQKITGKALKSRQRRIEYQQRMKFQKKGVRAQDLEFEEVEGEETSENEEWSDESSDAVAETLAMGEQLLSKRKMNDMIDESFNKHTFHDTENLPAWFQDDQAESNKIQKPITREEVLKYKKEMRDINNRPIKKLLEAKWRRKRKQHSRWERGKKMANEIIARHTMSEAQKMQELKNIYKKYAKAEPYRKQRFYLVNNKGGGASMPRNRSFKNKKVMKVDRRMAADKRINKKSKLRIEKKKKKRFS